MASFQVLLGTLGLGLGLVACGSESSPYDPKVDAVRARELPFLSDVTTIKTTQEAYVSDASDLTDEDIEDYRGVWGRLGFFWPALDLKATLGVHATATAAYYRPSEKTITVIGDVEADVVVHELVHALQDQHFDLGAIDDAASSTDEMLARRAVVEGDAELAQLRMVAWARGYNPTVALQGGVTFAKARSLSEQALVERDIPPFFSRYEAFVYLYGMQFIAHEVGLPFGRWETEGSNRIFRGAFPASTQEVLQRGAGQDVDPIVDVGLASLPPSMDGRLHVRWEDRLGQWLVYLLLLHDSNTHAVEWETANGWDGDQLLVIDDEDGKHAGIAWTTAWEDASRAAAFAQSLSNLHHLPGNTSQPSASVAEDGELTWLEQRDTTVVFVKNLPEDDMRAISASAFGDRPKAATFLRPRRILVPHTR